MARILLKVRSMQQTPGNHWLTRWRQVVHWRRRVQTGLRQQDLTLARWLALDCVAAFWRETGDFISQKQVAQRLTMDKATLSRVMDRLFLDGLIDRAPAHPGPEYRICMTAKGNSAVVAGRAILEAVSMQMSAELEVQVVAGLGGNALLGRDDGRVGRRDSAAEGDSRPAA